MEVEDATSTAHNNNTKDTEAIEKDLEPSADAGGATSPSAPPPPAAASAGRKRTASDLSDCSTGSGSAKLSSAPKKRVALRHLRSTASSAQDDEGQDGEGAGLDEKPMDRYEWTEGEAQNDAIMAEVVADTMGKSHSYKHMKDTYDDEHSQNGRKRSGSSSQTNPVAVRPRSPTAGVATSKADNGMMKGPTWDPSPPSCGGDSKAAEGSASSSSGAYYADEKTMDQPAWEEGQVENQEERQLVQASKPIPVAVCQIVGTGIASLELHGIPQQDQPQKKNEAMEQAATAAIRDALAKTSLHLGYSGSGISQQGVSSLNQGRIIAIQLGVPDLGIGGSSIDVSAACTPMWTPEQVSITSGIGGMHIAPAWGKASDDETPQSSSAPSTRGHVVVVASVTISEEHNESTAATTAASSLQMLSEAAPSPPNDLPSRVELQRRLRQAESIIENLLTESQRVQKPDHLLPTASSSAVSSSHRRQSQVTPTAADIDPDIEVRTYSSRVLSLKVNNPWHEDLPSHPPKVPEASAATAETDEDVPSQSSSGRVSASSSTSTSAGSFAVAAAPSVASYSMTTTAVAASASTAPSSASNHIKLDQLVDVMDQEEQKKVKHNYHDYVSLSDAFLNDQKSTFEKSQTELMLLSKRSVCFPVKIMILIEECQRRGKTDIVAWNSNGRAFKVWDHVRFENEILPLYLESSKYSSFLRQLNLYGFSRFSGGVDKGCYYHPKFLRGLPWIASTIQRTKVNGRKSRKAGNPDAEPRLETYSRLGSPTNDSAYWKLHDALKGAGGERPVASGKQSKKKK